MRHRHSVTEDPVKVAGIAAIAAAVGAAVAMLFTPRNGNQVRRGLGRRAHHLGDDVRNHFQHTDVDAGDVADEAKERLQTTATKVANDTKTTAAQVKSNANIATKRAKSAVKSAAKPRTPRS